MYGRRVPKHDQRVEACGCVDELTSALGLARATSNDEWTSDQILTLQKELITLMGELATVPEDLERYRKDGFQVTTSAMVDRLTALVDELEKDKSLQGKDWVVPGSSLPSAALDLARATCRRAERGIATLKDLNPEILRYLNRLSDLCWLLARKAEQSKNRRRRDR